MEPSTDPKFCRGFISCHKYLYEPFYKHLQTGAASPNESGSFFGAKSHHDSLCPEAEADEAAAEALALAAVAGAASVTVRRISDRNWNWELAAIEPAPSGNGLAQAGRAVQPLQFAFDLED